MVVSKATIAKEVIFLIFLYIFVWLLGAALTTCNSMNVITIVRIAIVIGTFVASLFQIRLVFLLFVSSPDSQFSIAFFERFAVSLNVEFADQHLDGK